MVPVQEYALINSVAMFKHIMRKMLQKNKTKKQMHSFLGLAEHYRKLLVEAVSFEIHSYYV